VVSDRTAAENDPDYVALGKLPPERGAESGALFGTLLRRYPADWVLKVLHAAHLMNGPDPRRGEALLRDLLKDPPDCFEGHSRLGTYLKYAGRRDEAMAVYEDALARWPWCHQAVYACTWMITDGMTVA